MSAVKLILKRSSILGKRPNTQLIEPGELALNTNSTDPGIFFEVSDGSIVKAGPASYLPIQPTSNPAKGEFWVDSDTNSLNVGGDDSQWKKVATPWLGGTGGYAVFVAPDYPQSTDSLNNDGQTVPFVTINRAIIEVGKQIVQQALAGIPSNNRYVIFLAPGLYTVANAPGVPSSTFNVNFGINLDQDTPTQPTLEQFNQISGGLILPRGVSLVGMDLKKTELRPSYVPKYTHPNFPVNYRTEPLGPVIEDQPLSSVFRWSGNTYVTNFNVEDKVSQRYVTGVSVFVNSSTALFKTPISHGLEFNDFVQVDQTINALGSSTLDITGQYYAQPVDSFSFVLSRTTLTGANPNYVTVNDLSPEIQNQVDTNLFNVQNIYPYFSPLRDVTTGLPTEPYEYSMYSSHRLSVFGNASVDDLNEFYIKIQKAFPDTFGQTVNPYIATPEETVIVAPTAGAYPNNLDSNTVTDSSPYANQVNHRSNYGLASSDINGDLVTGFKSVIVNSCTAVLLQLDPAGYQVYSTQNGLQVWTGLTELVAQQEGVEVTRVRTQPQLDFLNQSNLLNIRYYYDTLKVLDPVSGELKSTGITDINTDFRHFGFRVRGANAYMQAQSTYTIGAAIGCWAMSGAIMSLTNATTNFGSVAFQSEGFAGIGTLGGANEVSRGFLQSGIIRAVALSDNQVMTDSQKRILGLGSRIVSAFLDPTNPGIQLIYLESPLDPASLLPFSLNPGSALFVDNEICTYRGFFATDGGQTAILTSPEVCNDGAILRLRASDSTIPNQVFTTIALPYIRRYLDPRQPSEKSYGFYVQSTNPTAQAPQLGSVLRLNQTGQQLSQSLKRNYQLDPGQYGGISQVFSVDLVQSIAYANSVNYNNKISDATQGPAYALYISLSDAGVPWIQNVNSPTQGITDYNTPSGGYVTFENKNFYAAENNLWSALYYGVTYSPQDGPIKVSPDLSSSPFVPSNVLLTQELVDTSWQGAVPDTFYNNYAPTDTYVRGITIPYGEVYGNYNIDIDDSTDGLGIIYTRQTTTATTVTVSSASVVQTGEQPTVWEVPTPTNPTFGRPQIDEIDFLSVGSIINPKQEVSVLELSDTLRTRVEYVRVVSLTSNTSSVIRNYYPLYSVNVVNNDGSLFEWPVGTRVTVCTQTNIAEPTEYDPDWTITKSTLYRYYQLLGYSPDIMRQFLVPALPGQRLYLNSSLPVQPVISGYAQQTTAWPVEFNQPSTIIAGTHNWQYCGYFDYSRGLPKFQSNEIPRKLQFDFYATSVWGGRLSVTGLADNGNLIFLGPVREALTGNYYLNNTPVLNFANRQTYVSPTPVQFPTQLTVYSADSISDQFNGITTSFRLQRGGFDIPPSQLLSKSVVVNIGAVTQDPFDSYVITNNDITFAEAPLENSSSDIRIVTSSDNEETLVAVPLTFVEPFDGTRVAFTVSIPTEYQNLVINDENVFIFFSGTEQIPGGVSAYVLNRLNTSTLSVVFTEAPAATVTKDARAFCTGFQYSSLGQFPVQMYSFDDISNDFDSTTTVFTLRFNGEIVNPAIITSQNIFVSLGGAMQIPSVAYNVVNSQLIFSEPPATFSSCNVRLITNSEFIPCTINGVTSLQSFGLPIT